MRSKDPVSPSVPSGARAASRLARRVFSVSRHALRLAVIAGLCAAITACGFQLRGSATLPFDNVYIEAPRDSVFAAQLRRVIATLSKTRVATRPEDADATLQVMNEFREKEILSLSAGGRVRELQLRYRLQYQLFDRERKLIAEPGEIVLRRDYSFNDQEQLSKESEEALLYRDMQNDAVQQLVRRLQAVAKSTGKGAGKS